MSLLYLMAGTTTTVAGGGITFPITGVTNTSTSRSPSFTFGTAPATDDIIFLFISCTVPQAITDVSGWTNLVGSNASVPSDSHDSYGFYHRVTSGESGASTVTWTLTNLLNAGQAWRACATVMRGVDATTALSGSVGTGFDNANAATPGIIPSVTPANNGSQIVAGLVFDSAAVTQTTPGGWTLRANGGSNYVYSLDTTGTNGVPTGTTNVTPSAGDEYTSIAQAFKAA